MIKQRRRELGLSQRALARRVGVSDAYITQLETRERVEPSLHVLKKLAKALKVTVAELMKINDGGLTDGVVRRHSTEGIRVLSRVKSAHWGGAWSSWAGVETRCSPM